MSRIAIAAGGTGGHLNPALALAEELAARGHTVEFYGTRRDVDAGRAPHDYPYHALDISGIDRSAPWTAITASAKMLGARKDVLRGFDAQGAPDAVVGFGAYVEFPVASAAVKRGIPLVLHEQNSVPGMANKALASKASLVALTYPSSQHAFGKLGPQTEVIVTGNPVRRQVLAATREQGRARLGIDPAATVLLAFGGSLGARHINQALAALKDRLLGVEGLVVLHATGRDGYEAAAQELALTDAESGRWRLLPYIDDMGSFLASADLVLSRSGASSVAEIAARCVPSVLVPYPLATADHQTTNTAVLVDAGGARLVPDAELDDPAFAEMLLHLLGDPGERSAMRRALEGLGQAGAAGMLADAVERKIEANR